MPRGRPGKATTKEIQVKDEGQDDSLQLVPNEDYAKSFFSTIRNMLGNSSLYSPIWTNEILKDINMHNRKFDRERIKEFLSNPRAYEKELRELSQYLYDVTMQMKLLIRYISEMLTFDWTLEPLNIDKEEMKQTSFLKSYKKVSKFMVDLDPKRHLPDVVEGMLLEDAKFMYFMQGKSGYYFKELPSDYCKIWRKGEYGFEVAFDLTYFLKPGVDINEFAPEFRVYFDDFINGNDYKKNQSKFKERRWFYWQTLNPSKCPCFKYDQSRAGQIPVYAGLFLDANEIATFKDLLKSKTAMDVYKLLVAKIPIDKESANKTGRKDNFSVSPEVAAKYMAAIQGILINGVKIFASPLEIEAIDLNKAETKDSIVGLGNKEFWDTSGTSSVMFSGDQKNASTLKASLKTDEMFISHVYRQFSRFYDIKLNELSGGYKWRIKFEGTVFDKDERLERAMKLIPFGAPITYAAVAQGISQQEFVNMLNLESVLEIKDKLKPLVSAHTVSNKDGGRPEQKNVGEDGEKTRDNNSNER